MFKGEKGKVPRLARQGDRRVAGRRGSPWQGMKHLLSRQKSAVRVLKVGCRV